MKICTKCKIEKELSEFNKNKWDKYDGHDHWCRLCKKKEVGSDKNKIKRREYGKTLKGRFTNAKAAAHTRKLEWALTLEEYSFLISRPCFYCNNLLDKPTEAGVGLDRLDNSKGYIIGNVCSCCKFCNYIKQDLLTAQETIAAIKAVIQIRFS